MCGSENWEGTEDTATALTSAFRVLEKHLILPSQAGGILLAAGAQERVTPVFLSPLLVPAGMGVSRGAVGGCNPCPALGAPCKQALLGGHQNQQGSAPELLSAAESCPAPACPGKVLHPQSPCCPLCPCSLLKQGFASLKNK